MKTRAVALARRVGNQDSLGPGGSPGKVFLTLPPGAWPTGFTGPRELEDTALLDKVLLLGAGRLWFFQLRLPLSHAG